MLEHRGSRMGRDTHLGSVFPPSRDLASFSMSRAPGRSQAGGGAAWAAKLRRGRRILALLVDTRYFALARDSGHASMIRTWRLSGRPTVPCRRGRWWYGLLLMWSLWISPRRVRTASTRLGRARPGAVGGGHHPEPVRRRAMLRGRVRGVRCWLLPQDGEGSLAAEMRQAHEATWC
jgi:hypothetical protein